MAGDHLAASQVSQLVERAERLAQVEAIDPVASHASWMENFPWTRWQDRHAA